MAQKQTLTYKSANSTLSINDHVAKIIAPGAYEGLDVTAIDGTMTLGLTKGFAFTDEGVKIEETMDYDGNDLDAIVTVEPSDTTYPRMDLVVLRHRYTLVPGINPATYHVVKGTALPPGDMYEPAAPYGLIQLGDIVLAEVLVDPNVTEITDDKIFNVYKTPTTLSIRDQLCDTFYRALGNFRLHGWDLTFATNYVDVSAGAGILNGMYNWSIASVRLTKFRFREILAPRTLMGNNPTIDEQPDLPTKVRFFIESGTAGLDGDLEITGVNEDGNTVTEQVHIEQNANDSRTYFTINTFNSISSLNCQTVVVSGSATYLTVTDFRRHKIIVCGSPSGVARFKVSPNPAYTLLHNEMLLGYAETDETCVHMVDILPIDPFAKIHDSFTCDGVLKTFTLSYTPRQGSDMVVMDGAVLTKGSTKGYTLSGTDNRTLTLGSQIEAPDANTDLWIEYNRWIDPTLWNQ